MFHKRYLNSCQGYLVQQQFQWTAVDGQLSLRVKLSLRQTRLNLTSGIICTSLCPVVDIYGPYIDGSYVFCCHWSSFGRLLSRTKSSWNLTPLLVWSISSYTPLIISLYASFCLECQPTINILIFVYGEILRVLLCFSNGTVQ